MAPEYYRAGIQAVPKPDTLTESQPAACRTLSALIPARLRTRHRIAVLSTRHNGCCAHRNSLTAHPSQRIEQVLPAPVALPAGVRPPLFQRGNGTDISCISLPRRSDTQQIIGNMVLCAFCIRNFRQQCQRCRYLLFLAAGGVSKVSFGCSGFWRCAAYSFSPKAMSSSNVIFARDSFRSPKSAN